MNKPDFQTEKTKFMEVFKFRRFLGNLIEAEKNFIDSIFLGLLLKLIDLLEEITGFKFYIKSNNYIDDSESLSLFNLSTQLKNLNFISNFFIIERLPDEPKFNVVKAKFGSLINCSDAGIVKDEKSPAVAGSDFFSLNNAKIKCFGEAIERTCLFSYMEKDIVYGSYKNLQSQAINPKDFETFSNIQLSDPDFSKFKFDENSVFGWVEGKSLINEKRIFVPAQLVYLSYKKNHPNEPFIRFPISTGAAAHTDDRKAISKAICEVIERDAFMIFYLNQLSAPGFDLNNSNDDEIKEVLASLKRHNLEIHVLDISSDIPVMTYATIIVDKTGIGPEVVLSTKTGFDKKDIILGSIAEALKTWQGLRRSLDYERNQLKEGKQNKNISNLGERGIYWAKKDASKNINFLLRGNLQRLDLDVDQNHNLENTLKYLKDNGLDAIEFDITIPEAKKIGFTAKMVVIPKLQPLYMNEKFPYLGSERLYKVPVKLGYLKNPKNEDDLNKIPHPHI